MNLIQSGWPVAIVFRFGVRSINGVRAGTLTHLTSEAADPRFAQLVEALGREELGVLHGASPKRR